MRMQALAAALLLAASLPAGAVRVTPAHSGSWADPDYSNQGFSIEVLGKAANGPERTVAVYWYTFDDAGAPVWAVGVGETAGDRIDLTMMRTEGGARPPQQVEADALEEWATMTLQFGTCNTATADFEMAGSGETGSYQLVRITQIGATTCTGGMSDEVPADAAPVVLTAPLTPPAAGSSANGTAQFQLRAGYSSFAVDVRNLAVGTYGLFVGGELVGDIVIEQRGNGNGGAFGSVEFTSPSEDEALLLDFDPRGQSIEVVDTAGVIQLQVAFPGG